MEDIDICTLCCEDFGKNLRPRVMPCGHSYCTECLQKLIRVGDMACPECQRKYNVPDATEFPINFALESIIAKLAKNRSCAAAVRPMSDSKGKLQEKFFEEQNSNAHHFLQKSKEMKDNLVEYDGYLVENIERNREAAKMMRSMAERHDKVADNMENERQKLKALQKKAGAYIEELDNNLGKIDNFHTLALVDEICESTARWLDEREEQLPSHEITSSLKEAQNLLEELETYRSSNKEKESSFLFSFVFCSELPFTEKIKNMQRTYITVVDKNLHNIEFFKKFENRVEVLDTRDGQQRSAKISVKDNKIYLHHLQERPMQPDPLFTIEHNALMKCFLNPECDSGVCFMDLCWGGSVRGRLHILLSPASLPLPRQFTILCTGGGHLKHSSYAHTKFFKVWGRGNGESIRGGDHDNNDGSGGDGVIEGINTYDEAYSRPIKRGAIWTHTGETNGHNGQFFIVNVKSSGCNFAGVFGQVQDNLHIIDEATKRLKDRHRDVEVADCGVVLHL